MLTIVSLVEKQLSGCDLAQISNIKLYPLLYIIAIHMQPPRKACFQHTTKYITRYCIALLLYCIR